LLQAFVYERAKVESCSMNIPMRRLKLKTMNSDSDIYYYTTSPACNFTSENYKKSRETKEIEARKN
jgi:hypothetical protein